MSITVNVDSIQNIIKAQKEWLKTLQNVPPKKMMRIKALEGSTPEGADPDLYMWLPYVNTWHKITQPVYTRGILSNEILIDPDTPVWSVMKKGIEKLTDYCKKNNIPYITGFSGGKGIHVSIFFDACKVDKALEKGIEETGIDVLRTARRALVKALAQNAAVDLDDIRTDWGKINFNSASKGSQVRTFGTVRAPGQYKTLVDKIPDKKPEPYGLPLIFPEKVELWEIENTEFKDIVIDALRKEVQRAKKANEYSLTDADFTDTEIMKFPCIKKLFDAGIKNGRYYAGLSVLLMCKKCGISKEETEKHMIELFKTFPGITQEETELRINNALSMYEADKKFSCRELKDNFGEIFCKYSECPIKEKIDDEKRGKGKSDEGKPKKIIVHFDEVAKQILKDNHIFSMRDNRQIYLYKCGVYKSEGTDAILDTQIRNIHDILFLQKWNETNAGIDLPEHIPKAAAKYVTEVFAYIRAYTHITRDSIEEDQAKYINFSNCLFNLDTWETEDHRQEIKTICQIPVNYNKDAKCPKINDFLNSVVDEADINLMCEIAGYCLTTDCSFQKAFMLYGVGSNGKSVFLALLESLIGGKNTSAESLQKLEFDKYRTAKLYGKRVNICGDIPDSKMHKSEVFKKLTSGLDLIDGENKYQDSFVFRNTAKLVFSANILPEGKKDKAYYRRWVLIQFPNNFEGGKEDRNLISKLQDPEELSGFLNLALEGLKRLKENGKFSNDKSIEETQKEYEFNSNPIAAFMEECTQVSEEDCEATLLYLEYVEWCNLYGKQHISNIGFSRKLNSMGYTSHRENAPGSYSSKKIPMWDNLKIEKDRIGQDVKRTVFYPVLVRLIARNPR